VIEAIPASNDVKLPGLATTETLTRHVNLNYFSEAVSWEGEERLADADSRRITGNRKLSFVGRISIDKRLCFAIAGNWENDQEQRVKGREKPSLPHAHLIGHEQPDENYHA